jgi:hypothetical protein
MDTDHFLVIAKLRCKISNETKIRLNKCYKYDIEKLQDPRIVHKYKGKIKEGFRNLEICQRNEQSWRKCRQIISEAATEVIGEREICE